MLPFKEFTNVLTKTLLTFCGNILYCCCGYSRTFISVANMLIDSLFYLIPPVYHFMRRRMLLL